MLFNKQIFILIFSLFFLSNLNANDDFRFEVIKDNIIVKSKSDVFLKIKKLNISEYTRYLNCSYKKNNLNCTIDFKNLSFEVKDFNLNKDIVIDYRNYDEYINYKSNKNNSNILINALTTISIIFGVFILLFLALFLIIKLSEYFEKRRIFSLNEKENELLKNKYSNTFNRHLFIGALLLSLGSLLFFELIRLSLYENTNTKSLILVQDRIGKYDLKLINELLNKEIVINENIILMNVSNHKFDKKSVYFKVNKNNKLENEKIFNCNYSEINNLFSCKDSENKTYSIKTYIDKIYVNNVNLNELKDLIKLKKESLIFNLYLKTEQIYLLLIYVFSFYIFMYSIFRIRVYFILKSYKEKLNKDVSFFQSELKKINYQS